MAALAQTAQIVPHRIFLCPVMIYKGNIRKQQMDVCGGHYSTGYDEKTGKRTGTRSAHGYKRSTSYTRNCICGFRLLNTIGVELNSRLSRGSETFR